MNKPRMTLREVVDAMRSYGMSMSDSVLAESIKKGIFLFGDYVDGAYIIMRKDFEDWAAEYLLPYTEENHEKTGN